MKKINNKIAWLFTTMGYGDQLLYWEPILSRVVNDAPNTIIYLTPGKVISENSRLITSETINIFRITLKSRRDNEYNKIISLVSPGILYHIWKYQPDVIVLSEFGLLTIYGLIYKAIRPKCKALLLIESDPGAVAWHRSIIRKILVKLATMIMTNNDAGLNYITSKLGIPTKKIIKNPYLVSEPVKQETSVATLNVAANNYVNSKKIKILYVGQLAIRKGVDQLVKSIAKLRTETKMGIQVGIVGSGSEEDMNRLKRLVSDLNIEEYVNFIGRVPYSDLDTIYKKSDLFVLPTLNDYRALVGFEAISYGLPVLLSINDGSSKEIIDEGKNGYTFDPYNIGNLSEKIEYLLQNEAIRHEFSIHSKHKASMFTSTVAAQNICDAIELCLASK